MTLTEFLLARIAEDEAAARRATAGDRTGNWWVDPDEGGVSEVSCLDVQGFITAVDVDAVHVARHDPARALADCESRRRIVETMPAEPLDDPRWRGYHLGWKHMHAHTLRLLGLSYADHPDYQEVWRPA